MLAPASGPVAVPSAGVAAPRFGLVNVLVLTAAALVIVALSGCAGKVTQAAPASSAGTAVPTAAPGLVVHPNWSRPPKEERGISLPAYRDDVSGAHPMVVYASVKNEGTIPVNRPQVTASWVKKSTIVNGTPIAPDAPAGSWVADVLVTGTGTPVATLEPGQSGDILIIVTDPVEAQRLAEASGPTLVVAAR
jgi:hypothetical protein